MITAFPFESTLLDQPEVGGADGLGSWSLRVESLFLMAFMANDGFLSERSRSSCLWSLDISVRGMP